MPMMKGKGYWMKVLKPVETYDKSGTEWAFDFAPDDASKADYLKQGGFKGYLKNKQDDRGDFFQFKRGTKNRDGKDGTPFRIVGPDGKPWDLSTLIGNGSTIKVKYLLNDVNMGPNKGKQKPSALAIQVWDLVEYGDNEDFTARSDISEPAWDNADDGEVA